LSVRAFHARMQERAAVSPQGLTATATHDTKRGEDARMRVLALAELTEDWMRAVPEWQGFNDRFAEQVKDGRTAAPGHEYRLDPTLSGGWPVEEPDAGFIARMEVYALKAAREGKVETSWINPNDAYEAGLQRFVRRMLDKRESAQFIAAFDRLARRAALL